VRTIADKARGRCVAAPVLSFLSQSSLSCT
jgi:hypothetical protein